MNLIKCRHKTHDEVKSVCFSDVTGERFRQASGSLGDWDRFTAGVHLPV